MKLPVGGTVDLRSATTWFSIPYGDVQGDIVTVPRSVVVDWATFQQMVLPVLKTWAASGGLPAVPAVCSSAHSVTNAVPSSGSVRRRSAVSGGRVKLLMGLPFRQKTEPLQTQTARPHSC